MVSLEFLSIECIKERNSILVELWSAEGINKTLQSIREEKERSKQFLHNELNRLNDIGDRNLVEQYLNGLMPRLDQLVITAARLFLGKYIFGSIGLVAATATIIGAIRGSIVLRESKAFFLGITSLGVAAICVTVDEISFRTRLAEIDDQLADYIRNVHQQKTEQVQQLSSCFNTFIQNPCPNNFD